MANQQAASAATPINQQFSELLEQVVQRNTELVHCEDDLSDLFYRIGFISSACESAEWIEPGAAAGLCASLNRIALDLQDVIERLAIIRREVPA